MNFSRHAQLTRWSQRMCGRSFSQRAVKAHKERAKRGGERSRPAEYFERTAAAGSEI